MNLLADEAARKAIRDDLDCTLVVEAAAGTGKTTELIRRVLSLLCTGQTTLARIVAVTFTEKAAAEMKLRLRTEIEKARRSPELGVPERARLDAALAELEAAHISTIHGFCSDLLRERPVESEVDPLFETADEESQERLYNQAFERWFQATLADPPEGVRRLLRRRADDAGGAREALRRAGLAIVNQRDFDAPYRRPEFPRAAAIDATVADLLAVASLTARAGNENDWLAKSLFELERFMSELARHEEQRGRDYDGLEAELQTLTRGKRSKFWNWKGSGEYFGKELLRKDVLAQRDLAKQKLDQLLEGCDADLAACLRGDLWSLVADYERLKARAGLLDFLDLLLLARNLVRDQPAVRHELQQRFSHFLVDEFQDTDPLQAEILLLLAADDPAQQDFTLARPMPGKLFVVGDPKQSIYRFRRADVMLYEATKRRLVAGGGRVVHLTTSFRSAPSIQSAINAAFAPHMQGSADGSQAEYVPLEAFRDEPNGRPTVIALPVPRPYSDWGKITNFRIDESLPDAVAAFIDWLLKKSGWHVSERDRPGTPVPIGARHVCLLSRRFVNFRDDVTRPYVRALEARRIPHVLVGGRSFHAREEIVAVRNALCAIEWPDDEFSVFATLHGPFFALGDDALLAFRHKHGALHPMKRLQDVELDELCRPVADALGLLRSLHVRRNRRPIADTVARLLDATRAHAGVAIWPSGEQALANLLRILDRARRFEATGALSFRAFVQRLDEEAERGDAAEAPVVEEGTDGVRIMTVHKAKGLEFPVVILIDPTCPSIRREPSRYVDSSTRLWAMPLAGCAPIELVERREEVLRHDRAEAVRLSYVAATRARELLVVPVVGDERPDGLAQAPDETWLDIFAPVLYPNHNQRRKAEAAPGCPAFDNDSVVFRPNDARRRPEDSVQPGQHTAMHGTHRVVWWDPHRLELDRQEDAGLRQEKVLSADPGGTTAEAGERAHAEWRARQNAALTSGSMPSVRVQTVTELKSVAAAHNELSVELATTDLPRDARPHGKRFGGLVHAVLAVIDLQADLAQLSRVAQAEGRTLGAAQNEIDATVSVVRGALQHPLLLRAARATECRRESPVILNLADGSLVEGVVDLAFRELQADGPVWTIVDFKTDVELGARRADYEQQVVLYTQAVAAATGERALGALLIV